MPETLQIVVKPALRNIIKREADERQTTMSTVARDYMLKGMKVKANKEAQ
jgi:hypothetical protein